MGFPFLLRATIHFIEVFKAKTDGVYQLMTPRTAGSAVWISKISRRQIGSGSGATTIASGGGGGKGMQKSCSLTKTPR